MITIEHISLLIHIKNSENPTWTFLCNNFPEGMVWDSKILAKLLKGLRDAGMIDQTDPNIKVLILPKGEMAINRYLEQRRIDEDKTRLDYEKLSLDVEKLRNDFFDYSETKARSKWSFRLSWVAVALAVLTLLKELMCNKHG